MDDGFDMTFLQEQLRRVRELTDRVSQARAHAAEMSDAITRDRSAISASPLDEIRDLRVHRNHQRSVDTALKTRASDTPSRRRRRRRG